MDLRVGKNYQLIKKIGSGAFGEIYEGKNAKKTLKFFRQTHNYKRNSCYQAGEISDCINFEF